MNNIMDAIFNHMPGSEFYRAQVFPELFPHEKRMLVENWPEEDQIMWTGVSHKKHAYLVNRGSEGGEQ